MGARGERLLAELRQAWREAPVAIVAGPAGRGKSAVLLEYATERGIYFDAERHTLAPFALAAACVAVPALGPGACPALLEAELLVELALPPALAAASRLAWNGEMAAEVALRDLRRAAGDAPLWIDDALALARLPRRAGAFSDLAWLHPAALATRYPGRLRRWLTERGVSSVVVELPGLDAEEARALWHAQGGRGEVSGLPGGVEGEPGWIVGAAAGDEGGSADGEFAALPAGYRERIARELGEALAEARGDANVRAVAALLARRPLTLTQLASALRVKVGTMQDYLGWLDEVNMLTRLGERGRAPYRLRSPLFAAALRHRYFQAPATMTAATTAAPLAKAASAIRQRDEFID